MSLKDFTIIKDIGNGSFGVVLLVKRKIDNKIYALKRVKLSNLIIKEKIDSLNEIRFLASISHQNIIGYKESFYEEETGTLNLVLEYADEGDLQTKIWNQKNQKIYFKEKTIWSIFIQLVKGLKVLHDNNLMHRDLKSANIFIMKNGICKLGDLNISKIYNENILNSKMGTPCYAAPEIWNNKPYTFKSDIWSLGIILYELCCFKLPFFENNVRDTYNKVMKGIYSPIPNHYSSNLSYIIKLLLQVDPIKRPDCREILNDSIVKKEIENVFGFFDENRVKKNSTLIPYKIKSVNNSNEIKKCLPNFRNYESETFKIHKKDISSVGYDSSLNILNNVNIHKKYFGDNGNVNEKLIPDINTKNMTLDKSKKLMKIISHKNMLFPQKLLNTRNKKVLLNINPITIKKLHIPFNSILNNKNHEEKSSLSYRETNASSNNSKLKLSIEGKSEIKEFQIKLNEKEKEKVSMLKSLLKNISLENKKINYENLLGFNPENKENIKNLININNK